MYHHVAAISTTQYLSRRRERLLFYNKIQQTKILNQTKRDGTKQQRIINECIKIIFLNATSLCKNNYHHTNFNFPYKEINILLHGSNSTIDRIDSCRDLPCSSGVPLCHEIEKSTEVKKASKKRRDDALEQYKAA